MARVHIVGDGSIAKDVRALLRSDPDLVLTANGLLAKFRVEVQSTKAHDCVVLTGPRISPTELALIAHIGQRLRFVIVDCGGGVPDEHTVMICVPQAFEEAKQIEVAHAIYAGLLTVAHVHRRRSWRSFFRRLAQKG